MSPLGHGAAFPLRASLSSTCNALEGALWLRLLGRPREARTQRSAAMAALPVRREEMSAATWVFFQPPCSCLAYPGFSEQWDTAKQLPSKTQILHFLKRFLSYKSYNSVSSSCSSSLSSTSTPISLLFFFSCWNPILSPNLEAHFFSLHPQSHSFNQLKLNV